MTAQSAESAGVEIAGQVLLDDGLPPAGPITIELVCDGHLVSRTQAGDEGRFRIPAGLPDSGPAGCMVRASLAGYRADSVPVTRLPEDPDVAALVLHREGKYQGAAISVTWLAAPENALQAFHRAIRELRRGADGDLSKVVKDLESAVHEYPDYAAAWYELGSLRLAAGDAAAAHEALSRAIAADPWFISPYQPMLMMALGEQRWKEARRLCDQMLRMNPYLADAYYYRGIASLRLEDMGAARRAAQAIENGPEADTFVMVHRLKGLIHEREGDIQGAATEYWKYLEAAPDNSETKALRRRMAEWQAEGKIEAPR